MGDCTAELQKADDQKKQREAGRARAEAEARESARRQQKETSEDEKKTELEAKIVKAIGEDNWAGYKALRSCDHERAYALAGAGRTSRVEDYHLTSFWLEAMTAIDERDRERAEPVFEKLVKKDPDIDSIQQASLATDQAVLDLRSERRELGLPRCR